MKNVMKNVILINPHSIIDVITNSSSELFVTNANSIEAVKEMLAEMLKHWNEMAAKGMFGEHYVKNSRSSLSGKTLASKPIKTFEEVFGDISVYSEERCNADMQELERYKKDSRGGYCFDGYGYEKRENIGKILIESASDNSIPYEMFDWIESAFSGSRYHLG